MTQLTNQEIFDKALSGIRGQNYQVSKKGDVCAYRGHDGLKCAVGHCIDDETAKVWDNLEFDTSIDSILIRDAKTFSDYFTSEQIEFLKALQMAHDTIYTPTCLEDEMQEIADKYDLVYTPVEGMANDNITN